MTERLTDEALLPCPFCGLGAEVQAPEIGDFGTASVMCMGCYCVGEECRTEAEAIAAWNRRATPADDLRAAAQVLLNRCPNPVFDRLKPVLMGEFSVPFPMNDEDGDEYFHQVNVPWVVIKGIIHAALDALAQKDSAR